MWPAGPGPRHCASSDNGLEADDAQSRRFAARACRFDRLGGLLQHMNMRLIEPLRELFKDEVRAFGR
jgi:GMP synthase PP-ATPase subunit